MFTLIEENIEKLMQVNGTHLLYQSKMNTLINSIEAKIARTIILRDNEKDEIQKSVYDQNIISYQLEVDEVNGKKDRSIQLIADNKAEIINLRAREASVISFVDSKWESFNLTNKRYIKDQLDLARLASSNSNDYKGNLMKISFLFLKNYRSEIEDDRISIVMMYVYNLCQEMI